MTKDQQIAWAEALESGRYNQAVGKWYIEGEKERCDEHCCLAVFLSAVLRHEITIVESWELHAEHLKFLGIDTMMYIDLNDNSGLSFAEIAEIVRNGEGLVIKEDASDG